MNPNLNCTPKVRHFWGAVHGSSDGILDNYGNIVSNVYKPLNKDNITVEQLRKQSNLVFELYEKNLFVFDFSNMAVKGKDVLISNVVASLTTDFNDGQFGGSYGKQLDNIGKVNTQSTFYIINLPNKLDGVSGIDFSNAEIYVNGTKLKGALGGYEYSPADTETGTEEYFECYISAGVVEVDFYSKEKLLDRSLSLDNDKEKFEITIKNINFDNATGLSKIKVTDSTQSNLPTITSVTNDDILNTVYSWNENKTIYAYVQTGTENNSNKIIVEFNPFGGLDTAPKVSIKKGSDIKEIDIMAQIQKGLADANSLQDFSDVQDEFNSYRYISWTEDGYEIKVEFNQVEIGIQSLWTIRITSQLDTTYSDWLEFISVLNFMVWPTLNNAQRWRTWRRTWKITQIKASQTEKIKILRCKSKKFCQ